MSVALPAAKAKVKMSQVLYARLKSLQSQAAAESQARITGDQACWMMPEDPNWDGRLDDYEGMAAPFDRTEVNQAFDSAVTDGNNPGVVGDLAVASIQVDYLAIMERAFRARHTMSRARTMCHAMARKMGHGSESGPVQKCVIEYILGLLQLARAAVPYAGDGPTFPGGTENA